MILRQLKSIKIIEWGVFIIIRSYHFSFKINSLKSAQTVLRFSLLPIVGDLREFSLLIRVRVGTELPDQFTFSTASINSPISVAE